VSPESADFLEKVRAVAREQEKYDLQAYLFVFQALEFTLKRIGKRRHVSGAELLEGIRDFALLNFGAMGEAVFRQWGLESSMDFGRIVFALVEADLMSKTDTDDMSDFSGGFDFHKTFGEEYVPSGLPEESEEQSA